MVLDGIEGFRKCPKAIIKYHVCREVLIKKEDQEEYQVIHLPATNGGQEIVLEANLSIPRNGKGIVIFVHGSGSSRHSPRNQYAAQVGDKMKVMLLFVQIC
jgi:hypothetical protein